MDQMSLLAEATVEQRPLEITRGVLLTGANAVEWYATPPAVPAGVDADVYAEMLQVVEDALRYNQTPTVTIDVEKKQGVGGNGPLGRSCMCRWKGPNAGSIDLRSDTCRFWEYESRAEQVVKTDKLRKVLGGLREIEPETTRRRDLAEAYHLYHHYAFAYSTPLTSDLFGPQSKRGPEHAPEGLLDRMREQIVALGGDPALVVIDKGEDHWLRLPA